MKKILCLLSFTLSSLLFDSFNPLAFFFTLSSLLLDSFIPLAFFLYHARWGRINFEGTCCSMVCHDSYDNDLNQICPQPTNLSTLVFIPQLQGHSALCTLHIT